MAGRGGCVSVRSSPDGTDRETRPKRTLILLEGRGRATAMVTRHPVCLGAVPIRDGKRM